MSSVFIPKNAKVKKMSLDKIAQLEDELKENPLDYKKWIKFLDQVVAKDNQEQVRNAFEKYLEIFKFDGAQWNRYIKYELTRGEKKKTEELFKRCFDVTDSVELYRSYIDYVRSNSDFVTGGEKARSIVVSAFEYAIGRVGIDINSDELWQDYIAFLRSWNPTANWEQIQKTDMIRKVFRKYLVIPTESIETNWTQYTKWENEISPATAQKFVSERSAEFMLARSWNTEWQRITNKKLKRSISPYTMNDENVEQQAKYWANWIELEKSNSLELKDDNALQNRISYAYKRATFALPFVPQVWFEYVKYLMNTNEESNLNGCIEILKNGLSLNPKSLLLSFQLAELYEKDNSFAKAKVIFNNLISKYSADLDVVSQNLDALNDKLKPKKGKETEDDDDDEEEAEGNGNHNGKNDDEKNGQGLSKPGAANGTSNGNGLPSVPHLPNIPNANNLSSASSLPSLPKVPNNGGSGGTISLADSRQLQTLEKEKKRLVDLVTLVYSKFMTASKRAEGIKEARNVFKNARKFASIGYQMYVDSALLEHFADNTKTAIKVFDVGIKSFATDGEFLSKFLDYLIMINDVDRLRSTIQNADTTITKQLSSLEEELKADGLDPLRRREIEKKLRLQQRQLKALYKKYISFAAAHLSLDIANSFTKKCEQLFPKDDPVDLFTDRYKLGKRNLIKSEELNQDAYDEDESLDSRPAKRQRRSSLSLDAGESTSAVNSIQESSRIEKEMAEQERDLAPDNSIAVVGPSIMTLMTVLPNASYFGLPSENIFNSEKLVTLFANLPNISP
ncbi:uncharacterized protein LODBEIA_P44360 [Lodderomyces beijingensis]|uniref:mRNA 3'-end-processing protein RNA14 n=1 Tax=Lodderomyces beijingensis TaxID=1775926 RepID=A0ABP0ZQ03_9ASCO